jgi:hypothetical protein
MTNDATLYTVNVRRDRRQTGEPMTTPDDLARQLIDLVSKTIAAEAVLLQRRIDATLGYLTDVVAPNEYTVSTVQRFLTGEFDNDLDWWAKRFPELTADTMPGPTGPLPRGWHRLTYRKTMFTLDTPPFWVVSKNLPSIILLESSLRQASDVVPGSITKESWSDWPFEERPEFTRLITKNESES